MDEERTIQIEKTERGVSWTDSSGKRHEYERPIRTLHLQVQELASVLSLNEWLDDKPLDRPVTVRLTGKALIKDRSLSVIGRPETSSRKLDVQFVALDGAHLERGKEGYKPVCLSYTEYDWEIDNESGWWAQIVLPLSQFQLLAQAYESGRLIKLSVGLRMQDMFLDQAFYVPRDRLDWFIEPSKLGAEMAHGEVTMLTIETPSIDLRPPAPPETDTEESGERPAYKPQPQDTIAPALDNLSNKVGSVQKALRWIFWVLVVLLFVIGGSRH